jgi:hypothetical protein
MSENRTKIEAEQLASGVALAPAKFFSLDNLTGAVKGLFSKDLYLETNIQAQEWICLVTGWICGNSFGSANTRKEMSGQNVTRVHLGPVYLW